MYIFLKEILEIFRICW